MNHFPTTCELSQTFFFDAAHTLDRAIETAASRRIHGHTYNAEVFLTGQPDPNTGMVIDLGLVRREVALVREFGHDWRNRYDFDNPAATDLGALDE